MTDINGFSGQTFSLNGIITDDFTTSTIDLTNDEINLNANAVKINGAIIDVDSINQKIQNITATPGDTKATGLLDVISGPIDDVAITSSPTIDSVSFSSSYGFRFNLSKDIQIYKIGIHKDQWTGSPSTIPYNIYSFPGTLISSFTLDKITLENDYYVSLIAPSVVLNAGGSYQISIGLEPTMFFVNNTSTYSPLFSNTFGTYSNTPGGAYGTLLSLSATGNFWFSHVVKSSLKVDSINGITPAGGVFMLTSAASVIAASPTVVNLLQGATSVGSLTIPANTFKISSYKLFVSGIITGQKDKNIYFTLKVNNLIIGNILTMLIAVINQTFTITAYFSIRNTGGPGIADIITTFNFTYSNGVNNFQGDNNQILDNTNFDTTINNTLEIGCQIEAGSTTTIQATQAIIKQIY